MIALGNKIFLFCSVIILATILFANDKIEMVSLISYTKILPVE